MDNDNHKCNRCKEIKPVCCGSGDDDDDWCLNFCSDCCPNKNDHLIRQSKPPVDITGCLLDVVVMPNGEVLCSGKSLGWIDELGKFLEPKVNYLGED